MRFRLWTWLAVLSSIGICGGLTWYYIEQQRVIARTTELVGVFRSARVDLTKGFLQVSLADDPDSPFDREQGMALVNRAIAELDQVSAGRNADGSVDANEARALSTAAERAAAFRAELSRADAAPESAADEVRLRTGFLEVESELDRLDQSIQRDLQRLDEQLNRNFSVTLGIGAVLLAGVGGGMHLAGRAQARSQAELRAAEDRLQTIVNSLAEGVVVVYHGGDVLRWNQAAREMYGMVRMETPPPRLEDCRGLFEIETLAGEPVGFEEWPMARVLRGEAVRDLELRVRRTGAVWEREFRYNGAKVRDSSGHDLAFLSFFDITDRVRTEQALRDSEARFRGLVEQSLAGIYVIEGPRFLYVSPGMARIFGYDSAEDIVDNVEVSRLVAPADREKVAANIRRRLTGEAEVIHYEFQGMRRDGSTFDVEVQGRAMEYEGRQAVVGVLLDVSKRKQIEEQFRQAQKMEAIGTLAGGIAHDFNNILAAILGFAGVARMEAAGNKTLTEVIDGILEASRRAADLVRQILAFSRMEIQQRQVVQLRHVVAEAMKLLRASIPTTINFESSLATDAPLVLADASQVHQVIMNLATNAAHAMRDQPGKLGFLLERTEITSDVAGTHLNLQPGSHLRLCITDTGHGMEAAVMCRIFEPFFTTKDPGEGTGLGLAVVHGIMKSHDGAVSVHSEPGVGTRFDLYFPAHDAEEPENVAESEDPVVGFGECIMFVDDEAPMVRMGRRVLEHLGYEAETHNGAEAAWSAFQAAPDKYDLVITDLTMPGMAGLELAARMLNIRPDLPVILATGFSATVTAENVKEIGIRELLLKPFSVQSLADAVRRALSNKEEQ